MARGDAFFARGNCDWPSDPRCQALPDNDCRWLHEVLWRAAVKEHDPRLSDKYTVGYLASICRISQERVVECVKSIAAQRLIAFTPAPEGRIVVLGVVENHPKMDIAPYPTGLVNPYASTLDEDPSPYLPVQPHTGRYPLEREKRERREKEGEREVSSELPTDAASKPTDDPLYLEFNTVGKTKVWELRKSYLDDLHRLYGKQLNVLAECRKAKLWLEANPNRRKTAHGMKGFLVNWLNRACDTGKGFKPLPKEQLRAEAEQQRRAMEAARRPKLDGAMSIGDILNAHA